MPLLLLLLPLPLFANRAFRFGDDADDVWLCVVLCFVLFDRVDVYRTSVLPQQTDRRNHLGASFTWPHYGDRPLISRDCTFKSNQRVAGRTRPV